MLCDVCQTNTALGVASSTLGAMSNAYCRECLNNHAEPYWMFIYTYYEVGNQGEGLADWVKTLKTYYQDRYMTWDEFDEHQKSTNFADRPPPYEGD